MANFSYEFDVGLKKWKMYIDNNGAVVTEDIVPTLPITSNLEFHYDANSLTLANNDPVVTWPDNGSFARNVTQAVSSKRPIYKTNQVNGLPAVEFDGVDDVLKDSTTLATYASVFTIYAVTKPNNTPMVYRSIVERGQPGTGNALVGVSDSTNEYTLNPTSSPSSFIAGSFTGDFELIMYQFDGSFARFKQDGGSSAGPFGPMTFTVTNPGVVVGDFSGESQPWKGMIAEIVCYGAFHSATQIAIMENYFNTKYNLF